MSVRRKNSLSPFFAEKGLTEPYPKAVYKRAEKILELLQPQESVAYIESPLSEIAQKYFAGDVEKAEHAIHHAALEVAMQEKILGVKQKESDLLWKAIEREINFYVVEDYRAAREDRQAQSVMRHKEKEAYKPHVEVRAAQILHYVQQKDGEVWGEMLQGFSDLYLKGDLHLTRDYAQMAALELAREEDQRNLEIPEGRFVSALISEMECWMDPKIYHATHGIGSKPQDQVALKPEVVDTLLSELNESQTKEVCDKLKSLGGNPLHQLRKMASDFGLYCIRAGIPSMEPEDIFSMFNGFVEKQMYMHLTGQKFSLQ